MSTNETVTTRTMKERLGSMGNNLSLIIALIIIFIVLSFASPYFLSLDNIMNILLASAIVIIRASGATIAMLTGGLDISQNAVGAVSGVLLATLSLQGVSLPILILLSIVLGLAMGAVNSTLISIFKIAPIITTLGTMQIFRGIAWTVVPKTVMIIDNNLITMGRGRFFDNVEGINAVVPYSVVIAIGIFLVAVFVLKYTTFGRKVYMIGGNENASYLSGINAKRVKFVAYLISAVTASFAGFLLACQVGSALPQSGQGTEMVTLSAIILGGISLAGGKGSLLGSLLGILVLSTINNGLTLLSVNAYVQMIVTGAILILAVLLDVIRSGQLKKN